MMIWQMLQPKVTPEHLGLIPFMLDEDDPRPAKEQFDNKYCSGWSPFKGFKLNPRNLTLLYPEDPPTKPLAATKLRDELVIVYEHEWVAVIQPDKSFEVSRMD